MKLDAQNKLGKIGLAFAVVPELVLVLFLICEFLEVRAVEDSLLWMLIGFSLLILTPLAFIFSIAGLIKDPRNSYVFSGLVLVALPILACLLLTLITDH